jgi:hypothetical protein
VLVEGGEVVGVVAAREDRRVDVRVESLDTPAQQLRELGQVLDPLDLDSVLGEMVGGAATCDELDSEVGETAGELSEPCLVEGREKGALDQEINSRTAFGSRRCSTALTRSRSVSTVSSSRTGTRSAAITGPVSTPSST